MVVCRAVLLLLPILLVASPMPAQQRTSVIAWRMTTPPGHRVPGVTLDAYTLIAGDSAAYHQRAEAVMAVKLAWPLAVRTKDAALFDRILARDFTLREADGTLYDRKTYIRDRVHSPERVVAVRYENVVLQFFGPLALITYRNVLDHRDPTGSADPLRLTWADIFVEENGNWRIGASHLIDERVVPAD